MKCPACGRDIDYYEDFSDERLLNCLKDKDDAIAFASWKVISRRTLDMFNQAGVKNCLVLFFTGQWGEPTILDEFEDSAIYVIKPEYKLDAEHPEGAES